MSLGFPTCLSSIVVGAADFLSKRSFLYFPQFLFFSCRVTIWNCSSHLPASYSTHSHLQCERQNISPPPPRHTHTPPIDHPQINPLPTCNQQPPHLSHKQAKTHKHAQKNKLSGMTVTKFTFTIPKVLFPSSYPSFTESFIHSISPCFSYSSRRGWLYRVKEIDKEIGEGWLCKYSESGTCFMNMEENGGQVVFQFNFDQSSTENCRYHDNHSFHNSQIHPNTLCRLHTVVCIVVPY